MPINIKYICFILYIIIISINLLSAKPKKTNLEGINYLNENAKKEGVITLPSGIQFIQLEKGEGQFNPTPDSFVQCDYKGTFINGTVFDETSKGSPAGFTPSQVIKGWGQTVVLMVEGDRFLVTVPAEMAYTDVDHPKMVGDEVIIFDMKLVFIKGNKIPVVLCDIETLNECNDKQKDYLNVIKNDSVKWTVAKLEKEYKRLEFNTNKGKMAEDLLRWSQTRMILIRRVLNLKKKDPEYIKAAKARAEKLKAEKEAKEKAYKEKLAKQAEERKAKDKIAKEQRAKREAEIRAERAAQRAKALKDAGKDDDDDDEDDEL